MRAFLAKKSPMIDPKLFQMLLQCFRYLRDTPVLFPFTKALDKFIYKEKSTD